MEAMLDVPFADEDSAYAELHKAVGTLPGSYVATATWYGQAEPIQVSTTVTYASDSYALEVVDETAFCRLSVTLPTHVTIETSDGYLFVDMVSDWSAAQITQPHTRAEEIGFVLGLTTDPNNPAWLGSPVADMWPNEASPDDNAELRLLVQQGADGLLGQLTYETREVIDTTTVVTHTVILLEWSA